MKKFLDKLCTEKGVECKTPRTTARLLDKVMVPTIHYGVGGSVLCLVIVVIRGLFTSLAVNMWFTESLINLDADDPETSTSGHSFTGTEFPNTNIPR